MNPLALYVVSWPHILLPADTTAHVQILLRWIHFLAGITWIGMLYFFNLVNVPFMKELEPGIKSKVVPLLMPRALWWFRWGSVVTVLAGIAYWMIIGSTEARNAGASPGMAFETFFLIWVVVFAIQYALLMVAGVNKGAVLGVALAVLVVAGGWLFLALNAHGWESSRFLSIGLGGGMGLVMMLNVWGIVWRCQKRLIAWTQASASSGTAMPPEAAGIARKAFLASRLNFYLSMPMLFFMAAASHYPMFGAG